MAKGGLVTELETRGINTIRGLAMDAVQAANSGHPGTPMALAPLAHTLFTRVMKYDAADPDWFDRDRFVLSAGHASMLLYSMLYLCGFGATLDDLKAFRSLKSPAAGHPEYGHIPGIEVTTGPLGQGFGTAVGMAIAESHLRARFGSSVCDHRTWVIAGDGDLQEGISHEAASLAGHLGLDHLIVIFDDNHITIDGGTELSCSDNVPERFRSYGWNVIELGDVAEDVDAIERGLQAAASATGAPTLVVLRSHIGYPSPSRTDSPKAHGEPLGAEDIAATKSIMGMDPEATFQVPEDVLGFYRHAGTRGSEERSAWAQRSESFSGSSTETTASWSAVLQGGGLSDWESVLPSYTADASIATRVTCAEVVTALSAVVPGLLGGGADLTGNTGAQMKTATPLSAATPEGRQIHFGIREHAMAASMVGMALHGGVLPFGGTFFVFSDYMRPSIRLASLTGAKVAFICSHDSIGLGEDGPTHQPIEHLASLRAMPGLHVFRPADANETVAVWKTHLVGNGPSVMVLSRQGLPVLSETAELAAAGVSAGAYVLNTDEAPDVILLGTGSEVSICVEAAGQLRASGHQVRVVSMPCWERFAALSADERAAILLPNIPVLSVEAGSTFGWAQWADASIGIDTFGASAPATVLFPHFGITAAAVVERAEQLIAK